MPVSPEMPRLADSASLAPLPDQSEWVELSGLEDEEFPLDLPAHYDWMLQPSSRLDYRRVVGFIGVMATLLIALSAFIIYSSPNVPPSLFNFTGILPT
jgi:hypothetical protein